MTDDLLPVVNKGFVDPVAQQNDHLVQGSQPVGGNEKINAENKPVTKQVEKRQDAEKGQLPFKSMSDVQLKFKIDTKTNDVTVLVVDKASRRVIRTIPPEELKNMREGDLIQLST